MKRERHPGAGNVIDRVVAYFDPQAAVRRLHARVTFDAIGGFTGASLSSRSLKSWFTSRASANVDLIPSLPILRQRSRDAVRNVPLAGGAINTVVTSVVGTGLAMQSAIDADVLGMTDDEAEAWQRNTESEFAGWADTTECDITRSQDFYGLQDLVMRSTLENGDCFTLLPMVKRPGSAYSTRVQLVEADRVCNKDYAVNSPTMAAGVVMDEYGSPTAYHILRQHPGDFLSKDSFTWDVVPAFGAKTGRRNVLHHYRKVRIGQARGIPYLAPVLEVVKQLGRYSDAEIMAAVVAGMFTVFVTSPSGVGINPGIPGMSDETGATETDNDIKIGNGNVVDLMPGEDVKTTPPGRPNPNFDPFFQACVRQIGMNLEVPFEVLIKHFTASYSAARAAMVEAWKFFKGRRAWLVQSFCQPVYEAWLEEAVSSGTISAPGFFSDPAIRRAYCGTTWHGDAMPQIDPVKEVEAARGRVELGISDRAQETAALTGGDWDTTHRQQVREAKMRREGGLDQFVPKLPSATAVDTSDGGDSETVPTPNGGKQ